MIRTLMLHFIYDQCINVFFKNLNRNFTPPVVEKSLTGKRITAIEALIIISDNYFRVIYSDVDVISTDDIGMLIECTYGTMEEYPVDDKNTVYTNKNFKDYIKYEDILEIIQ